MRKILPILLSIVIAAVFLPKPAANAQEQSFSDAPPTHWAYKWIELAASRNYISGTGGGKFSPSGTVSNCMFVTMVIKATVGTQRTGTGHWAENYMKKAFDIGIASSQVMPNDVWDKPISRQEMAAVIVRASDIILGEPFLQNTDAFTAKIKDWDGIEGEYKPYIAQAYAKGIVGGMPSGEYRPLLTGTRAEACVMVFRLADSGYRSAEYSGIKFDKMNDVLDSGQMTADKSEEFLMKTLESMSFYSQAGQYFVKCGFTDLPDEFEYYLDIVFEFKNGKAPYILSTEMGSIPAAGNFTSTLEGMAKLSDLKDVTFSMGVTDMTTGNSSLYLTVSSAVADEVKFINNEMVTMPKKNYDFSKLFTWK